MAEETPETTEETTPEAAEATEAPATPEAPAAEVPAEEAPAAEAAAPAAPAEPEVVLPPKERRAQRRAAAVAKRGARRARTPEERTAERKRKADERRRYRARLKARRADAPKQAPPTASDEKVGKPKVRQGIVVSDKADKTITVRIDTARRHRRYEKILRSSMTLHAHDEANDANAGDTVRVIECRPMSRTKRWRLVEVLERAK